MQRNTDQHHKKKVSAIKGRAISAAREINRDSLVLNDGSDSEAIHDDSKTISINPMSGITPRDSTAGSFIQKKSVASVHSPSPTKPLYQKYKKLFEAERSYPVRQIVK